MDRIKKEPDSSNKKTDVELNELETLDLSPEDGDEKREAPVNPRVAAMQRVLVDSVETRNKAYEDEGMEVPGAKVVEELEVEEPKPEAINLDLEPELVDKPVGNGNNNLISRDGKQFLRIKVDGEDKEVLLDDAVTYLQKNENADIKLGQANNLLNQARTIQQSSASTPPDDSQGPVVDETAVNAAFNKLYDGDVDEAAKEFSTLLSKQSAPQVDISTQVAQEVARISDHNNLKSAFERFSSNDDFKRIASDQTLLSMVDAFTDELQQDTAYMATNPNYEDIFNEAGKRTNEWLQSIAPTTATEEIIEERRERKLNKPQAVSSRTARRGPKPETKAPTREDSIAKMARARGQTIY